MLTNDTMTLMAMNRAANTAWPREGKPGNLGRRVRLTILASRVSPQATHFPREMSATSRLPGHACGRDDRNPPGDIMERSEDSRLVEATLLGKYPREMEKDEKSHESANAGSIKLHRFHVHFCSLRKEEWKCTGASAAATTTSSSSASSTSSSSTTTAAAAATTRTPRPAAGAHYRSYWIRCLSLLLSWIVLLMLIKGVPPQVIASPGIS